MYQEDQTEVKFYLQEMLQLISSSDKEKNKRNTRLIAQLIHKELSIAMQPPPPNAEDEEEKDQIFSPDEVSSPSIFENHR